MTGHPRESDRPAALADPGDQPVEKRMLALDALSKLARQFSQTPEFETLMDVLLMTLCGQFSVGDALALLRRSRPPAQGPGYFGTGRLRDSSELGEMEISTETCSWLLRGRKACNLDSPDLPPGYSKQLIPVLKKHGLTLVCPLVHNGELLGIIGLGKRVTGKGFSPEDVDLMVTIADTIAPFLANTYLFSEIGRLNTWYLDILDSVEQGVFVFDSGDRLKKMNTAGLDILRDFRPDTDSAENLTGTPMEAVFGSGAFKELVHEIKALRAGREWKEPKTVVACSAKVSRVYSLRLGASGQDGRNGSDLIVTLDDVTRQRESEEKLFNLQQLADRGAMAATISHEINNFLGLLLGGLELTRMAVDTGNREKAGEHLDKLKSAVGNLEKFAAGLMDHSTLSAEKKVYSLNRVIGDVVSFVSGQQRFKGITIIPDLDGNLPDIVLDPDQIAQLLLNLLNNAADAISEADRPDGQIRVETRVEESGAVVAVSDNGTGIEPEVKDSLFKSKVTTKEHGHGYGLTTCAGILEGHNARIGIDSEPGRGSVFTIRFPLG
jgi:signal transduction histidine kinase